MSSSEMRFAEEDLHWVRSHVPTWSRAVKRILDLGLACLLALIFIPIFALTALLVKLSSRGPVFFCQERAGTNGRPFVIFKFRTMVDDIPPDDSALSSGDPRITPIGKFFRQWGIDEIPQLWNVIRGDMSLVGPRPTFMSQVLQYSDHEKRRLLVKPGMTGLAQVSGRNKLSWPEKIELDIRYIETYSLASDFKIMFQTIRMVVSGEGAYGED